ncbi:MAG: hypothetical protein MRQ07_01110 [Candidatus Midichloria sp.]|nr:hypothetical protein [Candidatus Midichloria sp.]
MATDDSYLQINIIVKIIVIKPIYKLFIIQQRNFSLVDILSYSGTTGVVLVEPALASVFLDPLAIVAGC